MLSPKKKRNLFSINKLVDQLPGNNFNPFESFDSRGEDLVGRKYEAELPGIAQFHCVHVFDGGATLGEIT